MKYICTCNCLHGKTKMPCARKERTVFFIAYIDWSRIVISLPFGIYADRE